MKVGSRWVWCNLTLLVCKVPEYLTSDISKEKNSLLHKMWQKYLNSRVLSVGEYLSEKKVEDQ